MSSFSDSLQRILKHAGTRFTASKLADESGIHRGDFSRLCSGKKQPTRDLLAKLTGCKLITPSERRTLTVSYLRDEVPAALSAEIEIRAREEILRTREDSPGEATEAGAIIPLDEALRYIYARAISQPSSDFAQFLTDFHRIMGGGEFIPG